MAELDPSIALKGLLINRNDENEKQSRARYYDAQTQEAQQKAAGQSRLSSLIPQAMQGDQSAMAQIGAINPELFSRMDAAQREHMKTVVGDLAGAVQWADSPEKWQYVQQYYGKQGINLSPYDFSHRQQGLVALGQVSEYLKNTQPDYHSVTDGGMLISTTPGQQPSIVVAPNPGNMPAGAPVQGGYGGSDPLPTVQSPADAMRLPPGTQFRLPDGRVGTVPGGAGGDASGGFPNGPYPDIGPYHRY